MSGDLYKIAVSIALTSNHAGVLGAMAAQLTDIHGQLGKLHEEWGRVKLAMAGGIAIAGGTAIIAGLKTMADHAKDLSKELATLKTQGLTDIQIRTVDKRAQEVTGMVPGSTESGNLKLFSEAYSLMGLENAKAALPKLAEAIQVFGAVDGNYKKAQESLYSLLRSGEMLGKLQNEHTGLVDPEKLTKFLDVMARVSAATGNKVNAQTLFGMVQQGAPALANMDDNGLMAMLMAAQQMGGPRAGTALTSLYQQFQGGTMTEARAKELHRLGLVGGYDVGRGGHLTFHRGALETPFAKALENNPLEGMRILQDAMKSHGFTTIEAQTKELFSILGRQTTQRLVSDFLRNMTNMSAEQERIKGGQGLDAQAKTRNDQDYEVVEHNLHQAWQNLMEAIGGPESKVALEVMKQLTSGINAFTDVVRRTDPALIINIAKGIGIFAVALTGAGAVALLAAIGPAGWIVGGIIGLTAAAAAWKPDAFTSAWQQIKTFFSEIGTLFNVEVWKKTWSDATRDISNFFSEAIKLIPANMKDAIASAFTTIGEFIKDGLKKLFQIGDGQGRLPGQAPVPGQQNPTAPGSKSDDWKSAIAPMSYDGPGFRSMIQSIAFGNSGGSESSPLAEGVYQGVIRAFRELMGVGGGGSGAGGGSAAGIVNASFSTGGGANDNFGGSFGGASGVGRALGRNAFGGVDALGSGSGSGDLTRSIAPFRGSQTFDSLAPRIMADLQRDFGLTHEQAAGVLGNLGHESGGFRHMQEMGKRAGQGGYGWAQWTNTRGSPRRSAFLNYAREHGLDPSSYEANYGNLARELMTTHHRAIEAVKRQSDRSGSMRAFEKYFEGAGVKAYGSREAFANRAARLPVAPEHPTASAPPPRPREETHVHNVYMDGEQVHRHVERRMVAKAKYPTSVGGMDSYGTWRGPSTAATKVA